MSLLTNAKLNFIDRVKVPGQDWSIGVPEDFVFSTDPDVNGENTSNPSGVYDLILIKPVSGEKGDFQSPYSHEISFVTLNYMSELEVQTILGSTEDYECVVEDEKLTVILVPFLTVPDCESYQVFVCTQMRFRRCQLIIGGEHDKTERREFARQLLKSIEVEENKEEASNVFDNQGKVIVDNAFCIGVPQGFHASDNADKQFFCVEAGRPYFFVMSKGQRESEIPDIMFHSEEFIGIHQKIEHGIFQDCSDDFSAVEGLPTNNLINTKTLSVRYGTPIIDDEFASFNFCVIVPGKLYAGVFRVNSGGHTVEEVEVTAKTLLGTISPIDDPQDQEEHDHRFVVKEGVLVEYKGNDKKVVIPETVKEIGEEAFIYCDGLISIEVPDGIMTIGKYAFAGCSSLTSITIPDGLSSIPEGAFRSCSSLTSFAIPESITCIGKQAFDGCSSLKNIRIPNSVTTLGNSAFEDCTDLADVTISESLSEIPLGAFCNCTSLTDVTIPDGVTSIEMNAFFGCSNLKTITLPDSVTEINGWAFEECPDLTICARSSYAEQFAKWKNIRFDNGEYVISARTGEPGVKQSSTNRRKYIVDEKWSFELPKGLELYTDSEHVDLMGRDKTAEYVIKGLQENGRFLFDFELHERYDDEPSTDLDVLGCRYDNEVQSGNAIQKIIMDGDDLFVDVVIKSVLFSYGMYKVRVRGDGFRPMDFTASLDNADEELGSKWTQTGEGNLLLKSLVESIHLVDSKKKSQKTSSKKRPASSPDFVVSQGVLRKYLGKDSNVMIPEGIKEIAEKTFSQRNDIKTIVVPEGVKRIGRFCFMGCNGLEKCYLPDSLEELGGEAFWGCSNLQEIYLGDHLRVLGDTAFKECSALRDIRIPKGIKLIDKFTFHGCRTLKHIVIPDGVERIGWSAFQWCDNLEYLFVPESVTQIDCDDYHKSPFSGNRKLVIYTPAGSTAQKIAIEYGIQFVNVEQGEITADNSNARTSSIGSTKGISEKTEGASSIEADQAAYREYLEQKELIEKEAEEKRQQRIAEAKAKGESDDDEVRMLVILTNDEKMGQADRKPNDFYKKYKDDFVLLKKAEILALREKVISKMKDEEYCSRCRKAFMSISLKDRFHNATMNYYEVTGTAEVSQKADEAIENTAEWYKESEAAEVRTLMDEQLDRIRNQISSQLQPVEPEWMRWSTAKKYLKVFIRDKNDPEVELFDDCSLFQTDRRDEDLKMVVEVLMCTKGTYQMRLNVMNAFPMYWGVSYVEIWKAAIDNEIVNEAGTYLAEYHAEGALEKIRRKNPSAATLKKRREKEAAQTEETTFSELDTLCMYAVADYERQRGVKFYISGLQQTYKKETKRFQNLKQKQIGNWFEEMKRIVSEGGAEVEKYEEGFRNLSLEERFRFITQPVFENYFHDRSHTREKELISALEFTGKWYDPCEMVYVEKKLSGMLQAYGIEMDADYDERNNEYMKDYAGIKDDLVIRLSEHNVKANRFDEIDDGEYWCHLGTFDGSSKDFYCHIAERLPWYWGVSKAEVWRNAFQNREINTIVFGSNGKVIDQTTARTIAEKYVNIASEDTYIPDNPYDRTKVYAELPPYDMVVENVEAQYGEITPGNIKKYLDAKDAEAQLEADRKTEYEKRRTEYLKVLSEIPSTILAALSIHENGVTGSYKPVELSDFEPLILKMGQFGDYEDAKAIREKLIEEKNKTIDSIKSKAERYEKDGKLLGVKEAKRLYLQISDFVDVSANISSCQNKIEELEEEERRKEEERIRRVLEEKKKREEAEKAKNYEAGKRSENNGTLYDLIEAARRYELAKDYKDAAELKQKCHDRAKEIRNKHESEVSQLREQLSSLQEERAKLGGFFKKKKRLEVEEKIRKCEEEIKRAEEPLKKAGFC